MDSHAHWNAICRERAPDQVSWFQTEASLSLALIRGAAPEPRTAILDVGAGASTLVDGLLSAGYHNIFVLDLSAAALACAQTRLGTASDRVAWLEGDILTVDLPSAGYDVWHDRAVFHFLTNPEAREAYIAQVRRAVRPGGLVLVATFAEDGPPRCSGLEVARYSAESLHTTFGPGFQLVHSLRDTHITPWGTPQVFTYCLCRWMPFHGQRTAAYQAHEADQARTTYPPAGARKCRAWQLMRGR